MSNRNNKKQQVIAQAKQAANQVAQKVLANANAQPRNRRRNNRNGNSTNNQVARSTPTTAGKFLRTIGSLAGGVVGQAKMGRDLGAGISRIFGQGDYQVQQNSLVQGGPPAFASMNSGIRIAHREYITDVYSSVGFNNTTYYISPSNSNTFPWLSKFALNFEQYQIKGLVFYFNSTSGNAIASANNALGVVGLVTGYDPTKPDFGSKRQCEDYAGCVANAPSNPILHPVECAPGSMPLNRYYVQTSPVLNLEDMKNYALGKVQVFTQGMQQAGVTIGELWVSYDIEFYNPKILPLGTLESLASFAPAVSVNPTSTQFLGINDQSTNGNMGAKYTGADGMFRIPNGCAPGYYQLFLSGPGTSLAYQVSVATLSLNLTAFKCYQSNGSSDIAAPNSASANGWHSYVLMVYKSDLNEATIKLTYSALPALVTFDWQIVKIPSAAVANNTFINSQGLPSLVAEDDTFDLLYAKLLSRFKTNYQHFESDSDHLEESKIEDEAKSPNPQQAEDKVEKSHTVIDQSLNDLLINPSNKQTVLQTFPHLDPKIYELLAQQFQSGSKAQSQKAHSEHYDF